MNKFLPLRISSAMYSCSMPLNLDTYRFCPFQCRYCFMRDRVIGKRENFIAPNITWLRNKFKRIYDDDNANEKDFLEMLLKNRIDLHCGTKSEAFQPLEKEKHYTKQMIELCNEYNQNIVFTTKSDTYYDVPVDPEHHSFQFSITNHYNDKFLEPHVPELEDRIRFYYQLKDEGFKIGLRIEPFIPNITNLEKILDLFDDIDYIHLSQLMMSPQKDNTELIKYIHCNRGDFVNHGSLLMREDLFYTYIKPCIEFLEDSDYQWNSRFLNVGNQECCCGDMLIHKCTEFDVLHLKHKYGDNWTMEEGLNEIGEYRDCVCKLAFTSNRWHGCETVEDFYRDMWDKPKTVFTPQNQYKPPSTTLMDFIDMEKNND